MSINGESSEYNSAKLLLEAIQKEYDNDIHKLSDLYSRTGNFIALITVFFGFLLSQSDYFTFFKSSSVQLIGCTENVVLNFTYAGAIVLIFLSGYNLFQVLLTTQYTVLDPLKGFDKATASNSEDKNAFFLMERYAQVVLSNKPVVKKKTNHYTLGVRFLEISIVFGSLYILYLKFIGL